MKPEDQIKALAELDGYFPFWCDLSRLWSWKSKDGKYRNFNQGLSEEHLVKITDYLTSYDAIIPLIQKQIGITEETVNHDFIGEFWYKLNDLTDFFEKGGHTYMLTATPAQLCEALLRATGKWSS